MTTRELAVTLSAAIGSPVKVFIPPSGDAFAIESPNRSAVEAAIGALPDVIGYEVVTDYIEQAEVEEGVFIWVGRVGVLKT